jgi:long-subunit fatty acid transport protein
MIKNFIAVCTLLVSSILVAQEGTSSPYSFYGVGDVRFAGTIENRSMGGISMIPDSIHINLLNPAMYSDLKLTNFSVAGSFAPNEIKTFSQTEKSQRTTLDYIAVGLPLKRFGLGFGLIPFSSVGYRLDNRSVPDQRTLNTGTGGLNKAFVGVGFKITKNFSAGLEFQYNFGTIETNSVTENSTIQYSTIERNTSYINGANFNIGVAYQRKVNKKISLFSALAFAPSVALTNKSEREIALIQSPQLNPSLITNIENKLNLPSKLTFGVGVGQPSKWTIGAEVSFKENSKFTNRLPDITNVTFSNGLKYNLGGYYIPKYNSYTNYLNRIVYKAGLRYENTGLVINNKTITDAAFTLGLSLPLKNTFSSLNLSYERGSRGTTANNLVQENYNLFSVGLSFNDRWFVKRKYN